MTDWAGLDVGAVLDQGLVLRPDGAKERRRSGVPAVVVRCRTGGPPLAGPPAAESIEVRAGTPLVSFGDGEVARVLDLWSRLVKGGSALDRDDREMIACHFRSLVGPRPRQAVLTIPDPLEEARQEAILEAASPARLTLRLLWRPVAVLLGFASGLPTGAIEALDGRRALVLHLGPSEASAAVLLLEVDRATGLLTPVRERSGRRARHWFGVDLARDIAEREAAVLGGDAALARDLLDRQGRAWRAALGLAAEPCLVRVGAGGWRLLTGSPPVPDAAKEDFEAALDALLTPLAKLFDLVLVQGSLVNAPVGRGQRLGELAARQVRRFTGLDPASLHLLRPEAATAALGAAEYARRLDLGLPTYFDFLPQIEINAIKERRVTFVPLVQGRQRIAGGEPYRNKLDGFVVPAGAEELVFTLAYEGEEKVRSLRTELPIKPSSEVPVILHVEQRPAAGFARVEVRTEPRDALGRGALLLDWGRLERTDETRPEALRRLQAELGFAYPDCDPIEGHRAWWDLRELKAEIERFLQVPLGRDHHAIERYAAATQRLRKLFNAGRLPRDRALGDTNRYGIVDTDGRLPAAGARAEEERLYRALLDRIEADFTVVRTWPEIATTTRARRQLYLLAGWCYGGAPETVLAFFRDELRRSCPEGFAIQPIGRCFARAGDIDLLFRAGERVFEAREENNNWIKAVAQVLVYRDGAARQLDDGRACAFLAGALHMLEAETRRRNIQQRFNSAALLLLGLLRYRIVQSSFALGRPGDPVAEVVRRGLEDTLARAEQAARGRQRELVREVRKFLAGKGSNQLIIRELDE